MKNKLLLFMLFLLVLVLPACSSAESNENIENDTSVETIDDNVDDVLSVEDIINTEGIYCMHKDGTITEAETLTEEWSEEYVYSGAEPLMIDRTNGDQLIYVGDMVYFGYSNEDTFQMEHQVEKYYWSGKTVDFFDIEVFEDIDIKGMYNNHAFMQFDTEEIFSPLGFTITPLIINGYDGEAFILSSEPKEYTYGYFEGTEWIENTDYNDIPYYDIISSGTDFEYVFETPVIKGKEGYFTIDLSDVEAGIYLHDFDSGNYDEYVIEIK